MFSSVETVDLAVSLRSFMLRTYESPDMLIVFVVKKSMRWMKLKWRQCMRTDTHDASFQTHSLRKAPSFPNLGSLMCFLLRGYRYIVTWYHWYPVQNKAYQS
eukprot:gb/GEZJ01009085.1/.p1 GENE.gb/GEZJ01009085.1/~~gb/GEZJ01009085.1/.p1  ORF type:complete len:102 (-),score=2.62 gb/GEZJ01009085.1/:163-468(-)